MLQKRSIDGENGASAVADIHAALRQAVATDENGGVQSERDRDASEIAHGGGRNGLRSVENVPKRAKIEAIAIGAGRKLAKKKRISEVGALEMRGVVARDEKKP